MKRRRGIVLLVLAVAAAALGQTLPLDHPAIGYSTAPLSDPVSQLGNLRLDADPQKGYLPAVLKALDVPVESQMAVFSKTSVQSLRIEPSNPRVLFFNDSVIVGWVRGGFVEIASQDPRLGMVFYRVDQLPSASPFARRQDCLHCHMTPTTLGVPGVLLRSVLPTAYGVPLEQSPQYDTDYRMPFAKLWGGWYVTGKSDAAHMGNLMVADGADAERTRQMAPVHLDSLDGKAGPETRMTPYSDIVALMVFEHQVRIMNLLIRAGWEWRIALSSKRPPPASAVHAANELAEGLLFVDEAPLRGEVAGTSGFAQAFAARGPRDRKGRSLRDLSLKGRLMRYPCSYMIYTPAFDALPAEAKDVVYRRMWKLLASKPVADRESIVEILRDTKPGLPDYFGSSTARAYTPAR